MLCVCVVWFVLSLLKKNGFVFFMPVFVICCWCYLLLVVECSLLYVAGGWLLVFGCLLVVACCVFCCVVLCVVRCFIV